MHSLKKLTHIVSDEELDEAYLKLLHHKSTQYRCQRDSCILDEGGYSQPAPTIEEAYKDSDNTIKRVQTQPQNIPRSRPISQHRYCNISSSSFCNSYLNTRKGWRDGEISVAGDLCDDKSVKMGLEAILATTSNPLKLSSCSINNVSEEILNSQENIANMESAKIESLLFIQSSTDAAVRNSFRKISVGERLLKTEKIWYLPVIDKYLIIERLKNKPHGVSNEIFNNEDKSLVLIHNFY
jgi:hypothetical protein